MERDSELLLEREVFTGPHGVVSARRAGVSKGAGEVGDAFVWRFYAGVERQGQLLD